MTKRVWLAIGNYLNILDIQEIKSIEIDEYCELCLGIYNDNYVVFIDSGDTEVKDSEIFYNDADKNEANAVFLEMKSVLKTR